MNLTETNIFLRCYSAPLRSREIQFLTLDGSDLRNFCSQCNRIRSFSLFFEHVYHQCHSWKYRRCIWKSQLQKHRYIRECPVRTSYPIGSPRKSVSHTEFAKVRNEHTVVTTHIRRANGKWLTESIHLWFHEVPIWRVLFDLLNFARLRTSSELFGRVEFPFYD